MGNKVLKGFNQWLCCAVLSYVWLCNPMDCSLLGSYVHGIFQARILEWVAIFYSRASSRLRDWTCISCTGRRILYHWATWEGFNQGSSNLIHTVTETARTTAHEYLCFLISTTAIQHFSAASVVRRSHGTQFWPMKCGWKWYMPLSEQIPESSSIVASLFKTISKATLWCDSDNLKR